MLARLGVLLGPAFLVSVFLVRTGPRTEMGFWSETQGKTPYTKCPLHVKVVYPSALSWKLKLFGNPCYTELFVVQTTPLVYCKTRNRPVLGGCQQVTLIHTKTKTCILHSTGQIPGSFLHRCETRVFKAMEEQLLALINNWFPHIHKIWFGEKHNSVKLIKLLGPGEATV